MEKSRYNRYVALIRAVNVGGSSVISMERLREMFVSYGLKEVSSYIQSGNILFSAAGIDKRELSLEISGKLSRDFGKRTDVFVLAKEDLYEAMKNNPFHPAEHPGIQCHIMFLSAIPAMVDVKRLLDMEGDEYHFHVHNQNLYISYLKSRVYSRRTINYEKILGVTGTARTWKVVEKLADMLI